MSFVRVVIHCAQTSATAYGWKQHVIRMFLAGCCFTQKSAHDGSCKYNEMRENRRLGKPKMRFEMLMYVHHADTTLCKNLAEETC